MAIHRLVHLAIEHNVLAAELYNLLSIKLLRKFKKNENGYLSKDIIFDKYHPTLETKEKLFFLFCKIC